MEDLYKNVYKKSPSESFEDYCHRITLMKEEMDTTWTSIANIINANTGNNFSADKYRKQEKKYISNAGEEEKEDKEIKEDSDIVNPPVGFTGETITINYDKGETISYKELPLSQKELCNPQELLKAHGYNPDQWRIKTAHNTKTTRQTLKGDYNYYASKIVIEPRNPMSFTLEDIDKFFASFTKKDYFKSNIKPLQYSDEDEFLEICLQDLHMGLLSFGKETGEDYDTDIAKARLQKCLDDIMQRCAKKKFKRIVLALLGDILHVDNLDYTTTKGTRQDVDTRPTKIFDEALYLLIDLIEQLKRIAPVEVVNIQGNHDRYTSYILCKTLEMTFRGDKFVKFYNDPNPRKWVKYGNVLIGYAHGDMKFNAASEWLSNECDAWSLAKYREVHLGHLHSTQTLQKVEDNKYGLIVRYLPALCASSAWEHEQGYPKSQRGVMSFVWSETKGLREIWCSNI